MHYIVILCFIVFVSCKSEPKINDNSNSNQAVLGSEEIINDTLAMTNTVIDFLKWYKKNYEEANSFGLTYQDKQGYYHVSLKECESYLNFLKSSGFISDTYVNEWTKYFKDKAEYMENNLQNEGPPEGFEFDLVWITQEPEELLKAIDSLKLVVGTNDGKQALLQMAGDWGYEIELEKVEGIWLIAYISTLNYDSNKHKNLTL